MNDLRNIIAVVTGASRGAGRAIASVLGESGATVYLTGRSRRGGPTTEGLSGTIDETAEEVTARGGKGIAVACDHTVDAEVEGLFERIAVEHGRIDLLVNNVWGGYERYEEARFDAPFWEQPLWRLDAMYHRGLRAHMVAAALAAPLMIPRRTGLVISTIAWAYDEYLGNLFYDTMKGATARMIAGMATELRSHGIGAVALAPGFMRTERVMAAHAAHPFDLSSTESPEYLGRAAAALAADPDPMRFSGSIVTAGDLARHYGFTDIDGSQPPGFRLPASAAVQADR